MPAFRRHLLAFLAGNGLLTAVNVYTGRPWWSFWPLVVWGFALGVHYLFYRARAVDQGWVDQRVADLHSKAYDMGHIDAIAKEPSQPGAAHPGGQRPAP